MLNLILNTKLGQKCVVSDKNGTHIAQSGIGATPIPVHRFLGNPTWQRFDFCLQLKLITSSFAQYTMSSNEKNR